MRSVWKRDVDANLSFQAVDIISLEGYNIYSHSDRRLAYYQRATGYSFRLISTWISLAEIELLYPVLHEAPEFKFVGVMQQRFMSRHSPTNLQRLRKAADMTQAKLSERSGVTLRSIQLYEQRQKDINKAQALTLSQLAKALGCQIGDLLELQ